MTDDASLQVNVGAVESLCGKLTFIFVAKSNGDAHLQIYCSDPSNSRKSGVLLMLDESAYAQLKSLITKTDATIERLQAGGQMRRMLVSFP